MQLCGSSSVFRQLRRSALLTWPGRTPPFYRLFLVAGAVLAVVIVCKLAVLHRPPTDVFGESMMLVYYGYAQPLSLKIGRGFYQDGIWAEGGFVPYSKIGGLTWREDEQVTLVMMFRWRNFATSLVVPQALLRRRAAAATRQDRDARHPLHGETLDLGGTTGQCAIEWRLRGEGGSGGRIDRGLRLRVDDLLTIH